MSSIFLSYSSADADDAARIQALLEAHGYGSVFRDKDPEQGIPPGARWLSELFAAVDRADIVVFLASPSSLASAWCQTELAYALARGKFVVQASRRDVSSHPLLRDRQAIGPIDDPAALVDRLVAGLAQTGHAPGDQFSWDPDQSPYPGLRRLTESDAAVLFGRDAERAQVLDRLAQPAARSVLVVGPSGSGKSSLVRAAVLPRLRLQEGTILLPVIEPGADPIGRVALELEKADSKIDAASIIDGGTTIAAAVDRLVAARGGRVVLFLDQAEDLVARAPQGQVARLAEGIGSTDRDRLVVIFALRSASLDAWLRSPALAAITPDDPVWVRPLGRSALRDVIVRPAAIAGIRFEPPELVERILDDTEDGRALPLLAALLEELARGHTRETPAAITAERYEQIGPVRRIIERRAAEATRDVGVELGLGEDAAVAAYLRLVEIGDDGQPTRFEVAVEDLSPGDLAILSAFERQRLVTRDVRGTTPGGEILMAVHEEVFRAWPSLVAAIAGRRADLQVRTWIRRESDGWLASGRGPVPLTGGRLEVALDWSRRNPADLTDPVRRYLAAARGQRRRRRILVTAVPILALVAIGVSALAIQANGARLEAESLRLAADSRAALDERPDLGLLLALQAHARSGDLSAQSAVLVALTRGAGPTGFQETGGPIRSGALDGTGTHAVVARSDATVLWDVAQARAIATVTGAADAVAISADGSTVALARPGAVEIHRWTDGSTALTCRLADAGDALLHVSDDGGLAVVSVDTSADAPSSHVTVLSTASCGTNLDRPLDGIVEAIDLDRDGALLALGTDGGVVLWDATTGEPLDLAQPDDIAGIRAVALGGSDRLAALTDDGGLLVWDDVRSGQPPSRLRVVGPERRAAASLRFRPDGSSLLVGGSDGEVIAVDPQSDLPIGTLMRSLPYLGYTGEAGILDLAVTDSGPGTDDRAVTVDPSGRLVTWDLAGRPRLGRQLLEGVRVDAVLSRPDGMALAAGGSSAWLLDGATGAVSSRNDGLPADATALAARDDTVVIGTESGGVLVATRTLDSPQPVRSPGGRAIAGVAVLPDGSIASVDESGALSVVSAAGDARSTDLGVRAASMAADDSHLFVGAADGSVRVVDPADFSRAPIRVPGHAAEVTAVAVRPDGRALATGSDDRAIIVWNVAPDGRLTPDKRLLGHGDKVTSLSWSGDGRRLASGSEDHNVILWDVESGREIGDPIAASADPALSGEPAVAFSGTGGRQLLVATTDGLGRWDMRPDEWVRISCGIVAGRTFSDIERQRYLQGGQPADAGCP